MAVPKRRRSRTKRLTRRTQDALKATKYVVCPNCGETVLPHHVCPKCGYYDGKQAIKVEEEAK